MVLECAKRSFFKPALPNDEPQDMVQSILAADLPPEQRSFIRVFGDCRSVVLAGNETTATVLTSITYHVLSNPEISARLLAELTEARNLKAARLEYHDIRNLPYLTAVINEAFRTSNLVTGRLVRYSDVADLNYKEHSLPRGVCIFCRQVCNHLTNTIKLDVYINQYSRYTYGSFHFPRSRKVLT